MIHGVECIEAVDVFYFLHSAFFYNDRGSSIEYRSGDVTSP